MQLVTFSKSMSPHGPGDTRLVSDAVAAQLVAQGVVASAEPWPQAPAPTAKKPQRPTVKPTRPVGGSDQRHAD